MSEGAMDDGSDKNKELLNTVDSHKEAFLGAMDDDFNTREAIAALFEFSHTINKYLAPGSELSNVSSETLTLILETFHELTGILGLFEADQTTDKDSSELTGKLVEELIAIRAELRSEKNFKLADRIRDRLKEMGVVLEDSRDGTTWKLE